MKRETSDPGMLKWNHYQIALKSQLVYVQFSKLQLKRGKNRSGKRSHRHMTMISEGRRGFDIVRQYVPHSWCRHRKQTAPVAFKIKSNHNVSRRDKPTFCCPVSAVTTLLTVVRSPGENSNTISSNVIVIPWPPSLVAGVKYSNVREQGFKTWKKHLLVIDRQNYIKITLFRGS